MIYPIFFSSKNDNNYIFDNSTRMVLPANKYGIKDRESRLCLHANRLKMYYPVIKKDILFETSNPVEFKKFTNK